MGDGIFCIIAKNNYGQILQLLKDSLSETPVKEKFIHAILLYYAHTD